MWQQSWSLTSTCRKSSSYSKRLHKKREAFPPKSQWLTTSCERGRMPALSTGSAALCVPVFLFPSPCPAVLIGFLFFLLSPYYSFFISIFPRLPHSLSAMKAHSVSRYAGDVDVCTVSGPQQRVVLLGLRKMRFGHFLFSLFSCKL